MAKAPKRRAWTKADEKELRQHSKARTPVSKISKTMNRSGGALRQKARNMGFSIGHRPLIKKRRRG
jgi:hypothetical protein